MDVIGQIAGKLATGLELERPLEEIKAEMTHSRLTLHLDRTGATQTLLDRVNDLERQACQFSKESQTFLTEINKRCKDALARTCAAMKKRIAVTLELKEQIEKDMKETRRTIQEAELQLERLERTLQVNLAMPERQAPGAGDLMNKKLSAQTGVLAELRSKIKAAAYTGTGGRNLSTLFLRFDRDKSGLLDEDEVRRAFRRACRIPPSAVSDAEIASLCNLLDEDKSGSISISEIIDFLCADVNVDSLQEQCNWAKNSLAKLKQAQLQSQADLRNKVSSWKIDAACSRVNPIKGLKLDSLPSSPGRPTTAIQSGASPRGGTALPSPGRPTSSTIANSRPLTSSTGSRASPRNPKPKSQTGLPALTARGEESKPQLDTATMIILRSKIKAAAYTGTKGAQLDVIFGRLDKDHSGFLCYEELKQAIRRTLRITPQTISDIDITALCSMLDSDGSGNVSIAELIEFVEQQGDGSTKPGGSKKLQTAAPDESAG
jgi:Ca2+-binding EF-hand superfamily protein